MAAAKNFLPQGLLKGLFRYDPKTGKLFWRIKYGRKRKAGDEVGFVRNRRKHGSNAVEVQFGSVSYFVHNLIWVYVTGRKPKNEVDHENRNAQDNRWKNLREATRAQNQANTGTYKNNKTGYRGVQFVSRCNRYRAFISRNGKNQHLGYFDCPAEAHEVWKKAAAQQHGDFANIA